MSVVVIEEGSPTMLRTIAVKRGALALLLTSSLSGVAGAQVIVTPPPPPSAQTGYCIGGPFTITSGVVLVHFALDGESEAPDVRVRIRLYDEAGNIVATRRVATLARGTTVTLRYSGSAVVVRPQATVESLADLSALIAMQVELFDADFRAVMPVFCALPPDGGDRIPN
jgi:hypothetical protein